MCRLILVFEYTCLSSSTSAMATSSTTAASESDNDEAVTLTRSRKRSRNVAAWKSSIRKQRRNSGQEYTSSSDTQVWKTI